MKPMKHNVEWLHESLSFKVHFIPDEYSNYSCRQKSCNRHYTFPRNSTFNPFYHSIWPHRSFFEKKWSQSKILAVKIILKVQNTTKSALIWEIWKASILKLDKLDNSFGHIISLRNIQSLSTLFLILGLRSRWKIILLQKKRIKSHPYWQIYIATRGTNLTRHIKPRFVVISEV